MNIQNNPKILGNQLNDALAENKGKTDIKIIRYSEESFREEKFSDCPQIFEDETTWIKIAHISEDKSLKDLFKCFELNPHILKNILTFDYIPEVHDYKKHLYMNLTAFSFNKDSTVNPIQISIILGENYVISLHHDNAGIFNKILNSLEIQEHQIRKKGADYLAYTLIDTILDTHIIIMKELEGKLSKEAERIMEKPTGNTSRIIHSYREELDKIRNYVLPLQQIVNSMELTESTLINQTTNTFLKNFQIHVEQITHRIDTLSNRVTEIRDVYNSSMSRRLDEIVRVLTVVTVIFAPGTFIVGIYGMNFQYMPELGIPFSYPAVLLLNFIIAIGMIIYFRRRDWI